VKSSGVNFMSKLFDVSSAWENAGGKSWGNRQALQTSAKGGLVKLWRLSTAVLLAAILAAFSAVVVGQAMNATLLGTVTDTSGAVVSGAKVTITETKTGVSRSATTNEDGNYQFPNLPPGQYEVAVEREGFKKSVRSGVDVLVNSDVRVNAVLQPGTNSETVVVTAEIPILQTDRADVVEKMESKQVTDLPLGNNRNFQNLVNLVPGATRAHRVHSEFFNAQDSLSTEVNGQARLFNNLQIEGVDDNERTGLLQIYIPPAEAIQTVDVSTSNYAAEFGRAGGAVTNVILKSGTNAFHGAAYEFNRVSALAAKPFFQLLAKAPSTYNYYGGNVGGPIIRNRLFFFGDILRIDDSRGKFDNLTVPRDDFRGGNFQAIAPATCSASNVGCTIYDPYQTTDATHATLALDANGNPIPVAPASRTPFPNNMIPASRFSPLALKILALVPHTNTANPGLSSNYQQNTRFLKNTTAFDSKFDFNRKDNDRYAFRFSRAVQNLNDQPIFGLAGGPKGGGFQGTGEQHVQSGALNHTHVFSPSLIVETRVGISHYRNIARNSDYGSTASDDLGITGVNLDAFTSGLTAIDIQNGFSSPMIGYSASLPWDRGETNINAVTNWTKIHHNHTFKWGVDFRRLRDDLVQAQTFGPRGVFRFGTSTTSTLTSSTSRGNNFAAFLIDAPSEVGRDVSVISGSWRESELFSYAQDKWQLSSKLTLDFGLRWELYFPPTPAHSGGYSNYDPANNTLVLAGIGGNPLNLGRDTFYHYFAPRFGLAYRFTEKFVLRGGFGISYEPFPNNQYAWNYPVRQANGTNQLTAGALPTWPSGQIASMSLGFPAPAPAALPTNGVISGVCQVPPVPGVACIGLNSQYNVIDRNFQQPYVESWNLALERALPKNFVLDVAYVGNHGVDIPMDFDLNAAVAPSVGPTCPQRPLCALFGRTGATDFLFKPTSSNYHALQTRFNHRTGGGLLLTTSYTFSKALAYRSDVGDGGGNDGGAPSFYLDFRRNYMQLSNNRRHTLVQSVVYDLPFGKGKPLLHSGWANWVAGGWQVSTVMSIMSGRPLDFNASGTALNAPGTRQTPDQVGPFRILGGIGPSPNGAWFDTTAFTAINTPQTAGNMSRFKFAGPRYFNLDAAMFKRFPVTERVGLEFRAEAFSITNTPQFDQPNANASDAVGFGHITGTIGGNRTVELGAKLTF
jgi:carboxypeptidase family protein